MILVIIPEFIIGSSGMSAFSCLADLLSALLSEAAFHAQITGASASAFPASEVVAAGSRKMIIFQKSLQQECHNYEDSNNSHSDEDFFVIDKNIGWFFFIGYRCCVIICRSGICTESGTCLLILYRTEGISLLLRNREIHGSGADIHTLEGVMDDGSLTIIHGIIGDGGLGIYKACSSGKDNAGILVQGQEGLGTSEDVLVTVEGTGIVNIISGLSLGHIYLVKIAEAIFEQGNGILVMIWAFIL